MKCIYSIGSATVDSISKLFCDLAKSEHGEEAFKRLLPDSTGTEYVGINCKYTGLYN